MKHANVLLFGGREDQVVHIIGLIPFGFTPHIYPLEYYPGPRELPPGRAVFLVLADPDFSKGLEKLRQLRADFPSTPAIFVTTDPTRTVILQAFRAGAADLLTFPVVAHELLRALGQAGARATGGKIALLQRIRQKLYYWRSWWRRHSGSGRPLSHTGFLKTKEYNMHSFVLPALPELLSPTESPSEDPVLACRFLGPFEISSKNKNVPKVPGKKISALLAYLLYHRRKPVHREILMETFWPDSGPESARHSLNTGIYQIRKFLRSLLPGHEIIEYKNECYTINPALNIRTDVEKFNDLWKKGRVIDVGRGLEFAIPVYREAAGYYGGDFLEDMPYQEWCQPVRDSLKETYLLLLDRLSAFFLERSAYSVAANICKKILNIDPFLEEIHQRLMVCYNSLGLKNKAVRQYLECKRIFKQELSMDLSEKTEEVYRRVTGRSGQRA